MRLKTGWVALAVLVGCGCAANSRLARNAPGGANAGTDAASSIAKTEVTESDEPALRNELKRSVRELAPVHFDYDRASLRPEARSVLARNAQWLKSHPDIRVQVAGHCDQRGTVEYNLALGQRRAAAVRTYYMTLGIDGGRVGTISYGNQRPLCGEMKESCWQQNRRAETLESAPGTASNGTVR